MQTVTAMHLIFCILGVLLLQSSVFGQTNRSTSGCSVPRCPTKNTTNSSCSSAQACYAYQVPVTNETFCAPSIACSLLEPCADNLVCSSNASVCLSSPCCSQAVCMPISLGVTFCNATIPTILPAQCYNHTVNSDATSNVFYSQSTSYCDATEFSTPRWVRFRGAAGTQLATSVPLMNRCGTNSPGYLNDTHPAVVGETRLATVCFSSYGTCSWQTSISITNCLNYFVYYLSSPQSCNLRYCTA